MIPFFRQIRQQLLQVAIGTENKVTKYLLYALGEIFLVVIGILIALGINNWNEERKNSTSENQYYCLVLDDLNLDYTKIKELMAASDQRIKVSKEILLELDAGEQDKRYLLNKFLEAFRGEAFVPRNVTYKDLVSSGNVRLLKDAEIKNSLVQFYSELENKVTHLQQNGQEASKQAFELVNSSIEFGLADFNYVNTLLGEEIVKTLPDTDWTNDSNSPYYKDFQLMLVFNATMVDRNKQVLGEILKLMEVPHNLLSKKCQEEMR
ncbi:hypothetical protein SAMN06265375_101652 [Muriicola jejuensis]|uniref:Uncharacterized protein n=1 Tax=Muriicola jejuensis TaxID=504488 RepID=A0A6P0UD39_9FLAO|nr:DUF6090 family protein [Muriicola jejuensis]NER09829.1 hypothetical protein [Muriicola jejuensis]SMP05356.1 hypothetical protein SAMN06265375_101652 [Muriicola jejuensis]